MCSSLVVPESGVIPSSCANRNTACAGVQSDALAMAKMEGCVNSEGEPDNVQKDLELLSQVNNIREQWEAH
jgi:hypothetical protein